MSNKLVLGVLYLGQTNLVFEKGFQTIHRQEEKKEKRERKKEKKGRKEGRKRRRKSHKTPPFLQG